MTTFSGGIKGRKGPGSFVGPYGVPKRTFKRHKGCPRGHLRCELWVLIGDIVSYTKKHNFKAFKGRSRRLRPKAHLGNPRATFLGRRMANFLGR